MFVGHFAVGFGAKTSAPKTSLGTFFLASQFLDLLWPTLLLLGLERVRIEPEATEVTPLDFEYYPISHSLFAVLGWALVFAIVYYLMRRYWRGTIVVGLTVLSHWLLDAVAHRPDLPIYPGDSPLVGLGLWSSIPATFLAEMSIFCLGVWLYLRSTRASDASGLWALWSLIVFLSVLYLGNLFGEPPPSVAAIAWVGHAQWIFVPWGYWIDRHRVPRRSAPQSGSLQ